MPPPRRADGTVLLRDAPLAHLYGDLLSPFLALIMELTAYQIITPLAGFIAIAYAWNLVFRQKKTLWKN